MEDYTQLRIKKSYRDRLRILAKAENRSLANMMEQLIERGEEMQMTFELKNKSGGKNNG